MLGKDVLSAAVWRWKRMFTRVRVNNDLVLGCHDVIFPGTRCWTLGAGLGLIEKEA